MYLKAEEINLEKVKDWTILDTYFHTYFHNIRHFHTYS